jgi:hypothetical protein
MMSVGWAFWYALVRQTETFKVEEKYEILVSTIDQTPARFLLTDPVAEMKFLQFSKSITDLEKNMRFYANIIGSCVIMFVLRILKGLDFQPRMALITRTISGVFLDLLHFVILFVIIFVGFTVAGYILFGHQYEAFSTFSNAGQFMILMLLAFDPTIWVQMEHATPSFSMFAIFIWSWIFLAFFIMGRNGFILLQIGLKYHSKSQSSARGFRRVLKQALKFFLTRCWSS